MKTENGLVRQRGKQREWAEEAAVHIGPSPHLHRYTQTIIRLNRELGQSKYTQAGIGEFDHIAQPYPSQTNA